MIYLDSAATSYYRPPAVAEAVADAIGGMGNCSRGTHEAALRSARVIYETRELISELFNGDGPEQTVFTANSTESLNMAIKGLISPGDHVVTTVLEHNSVLRPLYEMEALGARLEIIGCDGLGNVDIKAMVQAAGAGAKAVVCTHGSNLTGSVTDIRRIGAVCRKAGVLFIVDASQTAGVLPIDMKRDFIDVVCFTGHKGLMGPQGTGGMCVRKGVGIRPLFTGGSGIQTYSRTHPDVMPAALEAGTLNGHSLAGLHAALLYIREMGMDAIRNIEQELAWSFYSQVKEIPGIRVYGDFTSAERLPVVSLNVRDEDSGEVSDWLYQEHGICTRSGGHCAPLMHQAMGTVEQGAVRFSFSHFNTAQDVEEAVRALVEIAT